VILSSFYFEYSSFRCFIWALADVCGAGGGELRAARIGACVRALTSCVNGID